MTIPAQACTRHLDHLPLRAGQTVQRRLPAGTHLHVIGGPVSLQEPPCWLGEQVWQPRYRLASGQDHVLACSGWVTLWSHHDSQLWIGEPLRLGLRVAWRCLGWTHWWPVLRRLVRSTTGTGC